MRSTTVVREKNRVEPAVQESERRYKRLLASVTDYVFTVVVEEGRAVATAHGPGCEAVTGYTSREYAADPFLWYRMIHNDDRMAVTAHNEGILKGETPPPLEHRIIHRNGETRWIRNTPVPHRNELGRLIAYDGLVSDITERKRAEEQLERANAELSRNEAALKTALEKLKNANEELQTTQLQLIQAAKLESVGTLAAGVAHEVKNPLQTILMGVDFLANNLPGGNDSTTQVLTDMRDAVTRANLIIRELLQLSAAADFEPKEEDLNELVEHSLRLINSELVASQISVVRNLDAGLPRVLLDHGKMEQVLLNLFINALQAMSQGGVLTITTSHRVLGEDLKISGRTVSQAKPGEQVVIAEVQDTGKGIPTADLPKIFDPFFTTKQVGVGTGLGLSVAKKIMDLHGGAIDLRNTALGGAVATLMLRAVPEESR
jgi:PAS domain S-box-containing protein